VTRYFPAPSRDIRASLEAADRQLDEAMTERAVVLRRGRVLGIAGRQQDRVYRLRSGFMARSRNLPDGRRQVLMIRLPGDLLCLRSVLLDRQLDTVEALSAATVQELPSSVAFELCRTNADIALRFMWQLAEDDRRLHNWVLALGLGSAIERVSALILDLRGRLTQAGFVSKDKFALPITQQQIADHLGLTPIHVNRTFRRLREEGILNFYRGVIDIHDARGLASYAAPMQDIFQREAFGFGADGTAVVDGRLPAIGATDS
jgi:CRP-like cAMP-binding protein